MKRLFFLFLIVNNVTIAQTSFHNLGNLQIHDQGQIGFHTNLKNDGIFNNNLGFVGFYNTNNSLAINGSEVPSFFDVEVDVADGLFLDISTEISNSLTFTNGSIITPRDNINISLLFLNNSVFVLESNDRHANGYVSFNGDNEFTFPIGDGNTLRPLSIPFQNSSSNFSAAYFNEDPNFASTFSESFNTQNSEGIINTISNNEFWDFNGTEETQVTLTWDSNSGVENFVNNLENLRIVGWSKVQNQWISLGNTSFNGNFDSGSITSESFIPNDYEIITFASLVGSNDLIVYDGFSPNGDGVNDFFVIEGIEAFENTLEVFNRQGQSVFRASNYKNDWNGISNRDSIISRGSRVPAGVYYYVLKLSEGRSLSGPIYISTN